MNICDERHVPKYKILYHGAKNSNYSPEWLVCEICLHSKKCFGDKEQIISMMILA